MHVSYEQFGAVGDGVHDDLPAICAAHEHANKNKLPVIAKPDATYHLGKFASTAIIATDTDWNTARFIVDDTEVENNKKSIFVVQSLLQSEDIQLSCLEKNQKCHSFTLERDHYVRVIDENKMRYIRKGKNQNDGHPQEDCFIMKTNGEIEGSIDWKYSVITKIQSKAIDETKLIISGGVFHTIANNMSQLGRPSYWARNIRIERSNTTLQNFYHYVSQETSCGHPYAGFIIASRCAHVTVKNCFLSGHKIYSKIGSIGEKVQMGSYDIQANSVVNFYVEKCTMNHLLDKTRWGIFASNFCKNIYAKNSDLSRLDAHMGVSGVFSVERCTLGHQGLNAIGKGVLSISDSVLYGKHIINFRDDYGSTWDGDVKINNCEWVPNAGEKSLPHLFGFYNDGTHDFGYKCSMPREIEINGLHVQDDNSHGNYEFLFVFSHPDRNYKGPDPIEERPFPFKLCKQVKIADLTTSSDKLVKACPNEEISEKVPIIMS